MKWIRFGVVALLALAPASLLVTQVRADEAAKAAATTKSPEEMAHEAMAKWKGVLKLTDEQTPQFESIMTDSYKKMADAKAEAAGDKAKMKASMESILKEREGALSKVLTPEQMKTYQKQVSKNVKTAKKHMSKSEGSSK